MALFIWTNTLATGNSFIDAEHHELVARVNAVLECIAQRADNQQLAHALDALGVYSREHFAREEVQMQQCHYPGAAAHQAQHAALLEQLEQVLQQLRQGVQIDQMDVYTRLTRWVIDHIQQFDRDFAQSDFAQGAQA